MENNFYRDDFEQMLKDTTEEFRMYPSRKVWHSIYNDLHPDRKWPSFAVCLLLLTAILYIGIANNNNISKTAVPLIATTLNAGLQSTAPVYNNLPGNNNYQYKNNATNLVQKNRQVILLASQEAATNNQSSNQQETGTLPATISGEIVSANDRYNSLTSGIFAPAVLEKTNSTSLEKSFNISTVPVVNDILNESITEQDVMKANSPGSSVNGNEDAAVMAETSMSDELQVAADNKFPSTTQLSEHSLSVGEKAWIEDFAFHNLRNPGKWKTNLSFQYYITPSIGYRHLNKNNGFEPVNGSLIRTNGDDEVTQQAAPNFEAGAVMVLGLSKRLKMKSGLQFNLTKYNTYAHDLQHPTQTTVPMNDSRSGNLRHEYYNTTYGNVLGSNLSKLNNQTLQLSLPIGIDYRVAGNDKIKWFMGAGIQPSYIMSGNAYLISSDNKNFVQDDAMLRKWNASATVETFVSIKTPSGIDINVGPQLRYQLLSTYSKRYSYTEKLYNFGVKIGVTKKL